MATQAQSVLVSSGVTVTAASVVPAVQWMLTGFSGAAPESVAILIAGVIVALVHCGVNWFSNKYPGIATNVDAADVPDVVAASRIMHDVDSSAAAKVATQVQGTVDPVPTQNQAVLAK